MLRALVFVLALHHGQHRAHTQERPPSAVALAQITAAPIAYKQ